MIESVLKQWLTMSTSRMLVLAIWILTMAPLFAQEDAPEQRPDGSVGAEAIGSAAGSAAAGSEATGREAATQATASVAAALPESLRSLRKIYFYQSQAAEIVPTLFRPIDIAELDARLKVATKPYLTPLDSPQLIRTVYVARLDRDRLVSIQSYWDIAHRGGQLARLNVGKLGLALRPNLNDSSQPTPTAIVCDTAGNASVAVNGDTRLTLAWSVAGKPSERGLAFDLRIPAAMQTRFLLQIPQDFDLIAVDGVGQALPSPPPEAGALAGLASVSSVPMRWYSVDAGGLVQVRLRLVNRDRRETESILPVRQASIQYDLLPQSIRFTSRWLVDLRAGAALPTLVLNHGQATSIRVGGSVVAWNEVNTPAGPGLRIDTSRLDLASNNGTINLTIDGETTWDVSGRVQSLPWMQWYDCRPVLIAPEMQSQIKVDASLSALRLNLPPAWTFAPMLTAEDGSRLFRAVGPLVKEGLAALVYPDQKQMTAESVLKLSSSANQFQGVLEASIEVSKLGPQPIVINMDNNWTADLVTLPRSGRVLDLPNDPTERKRVVIWPTTDELLGQRLQVRISGTMPLKSQGDRIEFPATSFATIEDCRHYLVAIVTPPAGYNWTGEVALRTTRLAVTQLTGLQQTMVGEIGEDSLIVDVNEGRLAPLICRRPDTSFDTVSRFAVRADGDRLVETLLIACESVSTEIQSIMVDLGLEEGRPPMQWTALGIDGATRRIAAVTRVRPDDSVAEAGSPETASERSVATSKTAEIWRLDLNSSGERSVLLVGRREYPFTGALKLPLPIVPEASNQNSQMVVMPPLAAKGFGNGVLRVPVESAYRAALKQYGAVPAESDPERGAAVLRYDATTKSSVDVVIAAEQTEAPIVWNETVNLEVSNRGGDVITASCELARPVDVVIHHEVNLRLVSVEDQEGKPLEHVAGPSTLVVKASESTTEVVTRWTRPVYSGAMARKYASPRLYVEGTVLSRRWDLSTASDTIAPLSLVFGSPLSIQPRLPSPHAMSLSFLHDESNEAKPQLAAFKMMNMGTSTRVWIVDSSVAYVCLAMLGLTLFALSWWLTLWSPTASAIAMLCISFPFTIWLSMSPSWATAVSVPLAAGGLVAISRRLSQGTDSAKAGSAPTALAPVARSRRLRGLDTNKNSSRMQSLTGPRLPGWLWMIAIALSSASALQAQNLPDGTTISGSQVLIPTDQDGNVAGSKVYIPVDLFNNLFREQTPTAASVQFKSASYRLRLAGTSESELSAELEARYQVDDLATRSELKLPFAASQVRSAVWLTELDSRPLRWSPEGEAGIKLSLPAATNASLLLRITCELEPAARSTRRVRVQVPPVANATFVVDAGSSLQRLDLAESIGEVDAQPDLGRLNALIGAISNIDLTIRYREAARGSLAISQRRYWIHAGHDRTRVECEVDLSDSAIRKGTLVPLTLADGDLPLLTTYDWVLASAETVSPVRRQLVLQAQRDNPGPVRLLWEIDPSIAAATSPEEPPSLVIPDVMSSGTSPTPPAMMALHSALGMRLVPRGVVRVEMGPSGVNASDFSLSPPDSTADSPGALAVVTNRITSSQEAIDAFIGSWKGFKGTATEVMTVASPLTRFSVLSAVPRPWTSDEVHHLHVRPGELQLSYAATISPGDRLMGPLRLVLPLKGQLRTLTLNGTSVDSIPQVVGNRREVSLIAPVGSDVIRLRVVMHIRLGNQSQFMPPLIRLEPGFDIKGTYTLSRDQSLLVEEVADNGLPESTSPAMGTDQQLMGGWVPCWTWRLGESGAATTDELAQRSQLPGRFRILSRDIATYCQQRVSLTWEKTRWSAETVLRLRGGTARRGERSEGHEPIDFVNVELPTTWCENLTVQPAEAWSRQPSIDPATQIVRIRPRWTPEAQDKDGFITIRLKGDRSPGSDSRLEVPLVRVLGGGRRDVFVTVPRTMDGRQIDWEAIAATPARLPSELVNGAPVIAAAGEAAPVPAAPFNVRDHLVFRSVSGNMSVRLAPSRADANDPLVTLVDLRMFPDSDRSATVVCRWDLSPGKLDEVVLALPEGLSPLEVHIDEARAKWTVDQQRVTVPLSLSRLAQSIVMVGQIDMTNTQPLVPQIQGVPAREVWFTLLEPRHEADGLRTSLVFDSNWQAETEQSLVAAQIESIQDVTEASLSRATDRSPDESVRWIMPWNSRLQALLQAWNRDDDGADAAGIAKQKSLREEWNEYVGRIAVELPVTPAVSLSTDVSQKHWQVAAIARRIGETDRLPALRVQQSSAALSGVIHGLTLFTLIAGMGFLLWRGRALLVPFAMHPAFWLLATGLSSLLVAPLPVAIAICFVALTLPWLNAQVRRST